MTTHEVANRLVELCRQGQIEEAQKELYADHAISIESEGMGPKLVEGLNGIFEKSKQFSAALIEMHGADISDPVIAGKYFSLAWTLDATMKEHGRMKMEEICVYKVENGKIVSEQFFF